MRTHLLTAVVLVGLGTGCSSSDRPGTHDLPESGAGDASTTDGSRPGLDAAEDVSVADAGTLDDVADAMAAAVADATATDAAEAASDDATAPAIDAPNEGAAPDSAHGPITPQDMCVPACVHGVCTPSAGLCACAVGWAGATCDIVAPAPASGTPVSGEVGAGQWAYYSFYGMATGLTATLTEDSTVGLVWLYLETNQTPDLSNHLSKNEDTQSSSHTVSRSFASPGTQLWYVAAYGQPAISPAQRVAFHLTMTVIP